MPATAAPAIQAPVDCQPRERGGDRQHDPHARVRENDDDERRKEEQPACSPHTSVDDAAAREPEAERHRRGGQQPQLVPVADGIAQPS
jgi:hypothetical protein